MHLLRPTLIVGLALVASRVLGFVRDVAIAAILGAGPVADAFLVAIRLPNLARRIFGDGGLNAGVVPAYVRVERLRGEEGAQKFAGDAIAVFALGLAVLVAILEIAAPLVVLALAPAYAGEAEKWRLASAFLRILVPFIGLSALASLLGALLNAERHFIAAAVAPAAVNGLMVLLAALVARNVFDPTVAGYWLAAALALAGFCQLAIVAAALRARGWPPLRRPHLSGDVRRLFRVGAPALAAGALPQLVLVVAAAAASATPSAVSWLYYADRLFQLPLSLVGVAMGIVLLPEIARAGGDRAPVNPSLEAGFALALPAGAGLAVLGPFMARVLFERGAFGPADSAMTAMALMGLAPGLPAAIAGKVFAQDFFARETARMPLLAAMAALAATLAGALVLEGPFGMLGIAGAASLGFWVHAAILGGSLAAAGRWRVDPRAARRTGKLLIASATMGAALALLAERTPATALGLALLCLAGLALYGALALMLRAVTTAEISRALLGRAA